MEIMLIFQSKTLPHIYLLDTYTFDIIFTMSSTLLGTPQSGVMECVVNSIISISNCPSSKVVSPKEYKLQFSSWLVYLIWNEFHKTWDVRGVGT